MHVTHVTFSLFLFAGRFGNQADHFLGALSFANGLNRTLAVPPWVVYPSRPVATSSHVPFKDWFQVTPLKEYHRVITMEDFMDKLASIIWPPGNRYGFCYGTPGKQCQMKHGNPFGPFWDHFNVEFDKSMTYQSLSYSTHHDNAKADWDRK
jgi:peptide-O-fucosyltransferase